MENIKFNRIINKKEVDWAYMTAIRKLDNTNDSWKKRSKIQRFMDIFVGDLAKNLVVSELFKLYPKINIEEYDKIREDNFINSDLFDIKINGFEIEIKSSVEKYTKNINAIKNARNIIFNKNNIHEKLNDFIFQVFFIPNDLSFFKKVSDGDYNELELNVFLKNNMNSFLNIEIYIAGFVNKNDVLNKNETFKIENMSNGDKKREYLEFKIKDIKNIKDFRNDFINYKESFKSLTVKNTNKIKIT